MFAVLIAGAAAIVLIPGAPLGVITEAVQALAGVLLPSATVFLLLLCNDREVLGPWRNAPWLNAVASVIVAVLVLLSLILMATTIFPSVDVTTLALVGGAVLAAGMLGFGVLVLRPGRVARAAVEPEPRHPQAAMDDASSGSAAPARVVAGTQGGDAGPARLPRGRGDPADRQSARAGRRLSAL